MRVTVDPTPNRVDPANPTQAEIDAENAYFASEEFMNNKDSAIRRDDGSYYTWVHDNRVNVHEEVVYRREDSAYYMFYNYFGTTGDTYGWYIHNDDSKTNLDAASFQPSAGNTYFYMHDEQTTYQNTVDLCPNQAAYPWEVEYNGQYYKLSNLQISMSSACVDSSATTTIEIVALASSVTQ